jgi:hypothetical protein
MLTLHRITHFNEFMRCHASGEILMYGDFYYTDDDGKVISAKYYHDQKEARRRDTFDQSILENAESQKEYQDELRQAEQDYLTNQMLAEKVETKDSYNNDRDNGPFEGQDKDGVVK